MSDGIIWAQVLAELPWVTYLKKGQPCTRLRSHTPMHVHYPNSSGLKKIGEAELAAKVRKYTCKNSARWKYRPLKSNEFGQSGVFCWSHFIYGLDMGEMARIQRWLAKNRPELPKFGW